MYANLVQTLKMTFFISFDTRLHVCYAVDPINLLSPKLISNALRESFGTPRPAAKRTWW